jgi:hypothetical protein
VSRDDVRFRAAVNRADVDGGFAEHRIGRQREIAKGWQQGEKRLNRGLTEVRIRRVRFAAAGSDGYAERALGAAGKLALGGLAIDEELALRRKIIRRARSVRGLLFPHNEQEVDAILT